MLRELGKQRRIGHVIMKKAKAIDDMTEFNERALDDYTFNEMTMIE